MDGLFLAKIALTGASLKTEETFCAVLALLSTLLSSLFSLCGSYERADEWCVAPAEHLQQQQHQ